MSGIGKQAIIGGLAALLLSLAAMPASADWQPDDGDRKQFKASAAVSRMRQKMPQLEPYFEQAYAYAILPGITRIGIGFGGAYGSGFVVEGDKATGRTSFSQFTSGIQLGAKYFSMLIFFRDPAALEEYKQNRVQFLGQAGIDIAVVGASGTPSYNEGVALFAMTRFGLMGEFTISGALFKYEPLAVP